jgi:hypothetical protein
MYSPALTKACIQAQEFVGVVGGWVGRGARGGASHEMRVGSCGKKLKWRIFLVHGL